MPSWYVHYLHAQDIARDRQSEARNYRAARDFAGHGYVEPLPPAPVRVRERPLPATAVVRQEARRWTLRLARLAVTVSLDPRVAAQAAAGEPEAVS